MKRTVIVLLAMLLVLTAGIRAEEKRPLTFRDLVGFERVGDPQISPDGSRLAYVVEKNSLEENATTAHIWLMSLGDGSTFQLTNGAKRDTQPRWSPDGRSLAFVSNRDGAGQIWVINVNGGEARKVTTLSTGASAPRWAPDGKSLLFTSSVYPDCKDDKENKKRLDEKEKSKVKAELYSSLMVRHWNSFEDGRFSHVFQVPAGGGEAKDLTPGAYNTPPIALGSNHDYTFSPDGSELCWVVNRDPVVTLSTNNDVYARTLADGAEKKISQSPGCDSQPRYSPDGKYLAFKSMERAGFESDRERLMLYDREKSSLTELTKDFDLSVGSFAWTGASDKLYFNVEEKGHYRLYAVDLKGEIAKVSEEANVYDFNLDPAGRFVVFRSGSFKKPTELYILDLASKASRQLTDLNGPKLESIALGEYEEFSFTGAKAAKVHGFLVKPPNFDPAKKYPLVLIIHGGPQQMSTNTFGYGWSSQMFASPGYVVALINPRGSGGYGQKFKDEISGDWGGKVYEDLMAGVDYLVATYPFIDGKRMAAAGGSYGGYMANWIEGHTDRFRCLMSHCGAFDLVSKYGTTDELWFPEWDIPGTPWGNPATYRKWSPSTYAKSFKTPMLIIHGQTDYRVPVEEAMQMFTALQRQGVPSKLLYYPDEGHWVLKLQNQQLWYATFLDWLAKWLNE